MTASKRIGFVGAGRMGHGMARNIVEKGFPLAVIGHRNRAPIEDLIARGATEAASIADLARTSDIVFFCVPSLKEVEAGVHGRGGLLEGARDGLILVDSTTVDPTAVDPLIADLARAGVRYVDAPLARNPDHAETGTLNTMVGADAATLAEIRPVLETFSETVFHIGPVGTAHRLKVINNLLALGIGALVCEAAATAAKADIDLAMLAEIVPRGGAQSSAFDRIMPWIMGTGESGQNFKLRLAQKDMRCYLALAEAVGAPALIGHTIHQCFALADGLGYGDDIAPALAQTFGRIAGIALGPKTDREEEPTP